MSDRIDDVGRGDLGEEDLAALRAIGARLAGTDVVWETPPDGLWDRIAAAVEHAPGTAAPTPAPSAPTVAAAPAPAALPTASPSASPGAAPPEAARPEATSTPAGSPVVPPPPDVSAGAQGGTVIPFGRSGRALRRWMVPAVSIAAALIAALAFGVIANRSDEPEVLASAPLDLLGETGSGRAELVDDGGTLQLRLETADLDAGDGFLEVWVIDPSVTKLVSLGPLRPDGVYDLPAGLDPAAFPIVDVSIEPVDGNPTHSGNSVLRGRLPV